MLNKRLYEALKKAFGRVWVVNEDVPADIIKVPGEWGSGQWRFDPGGDHGEQYRVNCPFCKGKGGHPDTNGHLYISHLCFASPVINGIQMSAGGLIANCVRANCLIDPANRDTLIRRIWAGLTDGGDVPVIDSVEVKDETVYADPVTTDGIRHWASAYMPCDENTPDVIVDYLCNVRCLDPATIEYRNLGWGVVSTPRTGSMINGGRLHVIIPVIMNNAVAGIQCRCPDSLLPEDGIRYWTHPGMRKAAVVYGLDGARDVGIGVVTEGPFDAMKVGKPGCCLFGHTMSIRQRMLLQTVGQGLILLPDTDQDGKFVQEARNNAMMLNAEGVFPLGVHVVVLPAKDPGEMKRQQIWIEIIRQVPDTMRQYIVEHVINNVR